MELSPNHVGFVQKNHPTNTVAIWSGGEPPQCSRPTRYIRAMFHFWIFPNPKVANSGNTFTGKLIKRKTSNLPALRPAELRTRQALEEGLQKLSEVAEKECRWLREAVEASSWVKRLGKSAGSSVQGPASQEFTVLFASFGVNDTLELGAQKGMTQGVGNEPEGGSLKRKPKGMIIDHSLIPC